MRFRCVVSAVGSMYGKTTIQSSDKLVKIYNFKKEKMSIEKYFIIIQYLKLFKLLFIIM